MAEIGASDNPGSPLGCPSGLAPVEATVSGANPEAFVRRKADTSTLDLAVFGAKCAGCISKIEGGLRELPGVETVRLNLSTGKLHVSWRGGLRSGDVVDAITALGYRATPYDPAAAEEEKDAEGRFLLRCMAVAGFAMANIMLLSVSVWASTGGEMGVGTRALMHLISGMIAIPAALYAGRPFFSSAWRALKARQANMDVPISLAVFLALGFSLYETFNHGGQAYFDAAVMLLFFLLIGRWLDHALRFKAGAAARDLVALQAVTSNRVSSDGTVTAVSAKEIEPGDRLLLSPGDRVPVTVEIVEGMSDMDVSLVTGESAPALMKAGTRIEAGVVNLSQAITVKALARVEDSLVAELARLVEAGQQSKSRFVRIADKAAKAYVPIVHTLAALTFIGWFFVADAGLRIGIMNAIAVLIITCPCAMGLATPAVQVVATGRLFREGILVKTGDALERLAQVDRFVFDKTGTLTLGKLRLVNQDTVPPQILAAAAALARTSRHPISRAIVAAAGSGPVAEEVSEEPGRGIAGMFEGEPVRLGARGFAGETEDGAEQRTTAAWVRFGNRPPVELIFEDTMRPETATLISNLKAQGYGVIMLSGDQPVPAAAIADAAGIDDWQAGLSPTDKLEVLQGFQARGERIAMVGDGLNDAPALALAHVSLSPGTATQAAQSAADFVFQGDSLGAVGNALNVARKSQRHIVENFIFSAFYNLFAAPLAMAGFVTPLIAALAMSGSSLIVILNALRLSGRRRNAS